MSGVAGGLSQDQSWCTGPTGRVSWTLPCSLLRLGRIHCNWKGIKGVREGTVDEGHVKYSPAPDVIRIRAGMEEVTRVLVRLADLP